MNTAQIARVTHEANRAYCFGFRDYSQAPWNDAPDWQRDSAMNGVQGIIDGRITKPEQSHEGWLAEKTQAGWVYGEEKNEDNKTHPCMVPYHELPAEQRLKDALFFAIVKALS